MNSLDMSDEELNKIRERGEIEHQQHEEHMDKIHQRIMENIKSIDKNLDCIDIPGGITDNIEKHCDGIIKSLDEQNKWLHITNIVARTAVIIMVLCIIVMIIVVTIKY
jgi:hypothetical protein